MADMRDESIYKRPYVRPNENWVCGRSAEGRPCPHGPTRRGKCAIQFECSPAQIGNRWVCTRPDQYGGPCDSPALPSPSFGPYLKEGKVECCRKVHCAPYRSLRARRGIVTLVFCALIIGAMLVAIGGPWRDKFFSPGPLTSHHQGAAMASLESMEQGKLHTAEVGGGGEDEGCHICHTALDSGLRGLVTSALDGTRKTTQSAQCLVCHEADLGGDALVAHALPPAILAQRTEEAKQEDTTASKPLSVMLASFLPGVKTSGEGQMACAACHHEHNGALFDLTRMDNASCQTCHTRQFKRVGNGHPEFSTRASAAAYDYPYRRRTRIIYDHARHETTHFLKEEYRAIAPGDCTDCHVAGEGAGTTQLVPFEQMCASCHANNIVSARDEWMHVFGFPSVETDVYDILEDEIKAEAVPRTAGKSLSPFMLLLLSGMNDASPEAVQAFRADLAKVMKFEGDLSAIAYDDDPEIVARLFGGLKSVRQAAMKNDEGGMRNTFQNLLQRAGGGALSAREVDALLGSPEPEISIEKIEDEVSRKDIVEMSGWHVRNGGYHIDPKSWSATILMIEEYAALKAAGGGGAAFELFSGYSGFKEWFEKHVSVEGDTWILKQTGEELKSKDWQALIAALPGSDKDQAQDKKSGTEEEKKKAAKAEDAPAAEASAAEPFASWLGNLSKVKRWFEATIDTAGGAWSLRTPRSLYYRPVQHADPFIVAWLDFTGPLYTSNPAAAMVFDQVSGRKTGSAVGACTKCHSVDAEKTPEGETVVHVNWKSRPSNGDFTKFNHAPHLKLMNCTECHRAPWVPAALDRVQVATAASAEQETAADAPEESVAQSAPEPAQADEVPATEVEAGTSAGEASPAEGAQASSADEPAAGDAVMDYLDSFKAGDESLEISVDFMNRGRAAGALAFTSSFEPIARVDCVRCHVPGKAGDNCLICHNYHIQPSIDTAGIRSLNELIPASVDTAESTDTSAK